VHFGQKVISELEFQFQHRFSDLDVKSEEISIFGNPFSFDIEKLPLALQMETIDCGNVMMRIKNKISRRDFV